MRFSRVSIGWLMVGIAMLGVPCALVRNAMWGESYLTGLGLYDMGLWPGLVTLPAVSYVVVRRRGKGVPFLWGFATTGWASLLAYLACCIEKSPLPKRAVVFYFDSLDKDWWLM